MTIRMIPLNLLVPSPHNVRKTGATAEIDALAASIAAHGLLQNLQVRPRGRSKFEVVAGGRRLAALRLLVKNKTMNAKAEIPCHVLDAEDAREISLAENTLRLPMHPADQFDAFRALTEAGAGPEDIAARFGTTAATVRQRLKLAAVSPRLMQLYRDNEISLDQLMAFAVSDDHAAQEAAWFERPEWQRSPAAIRRALTAAHVEADDDRVQFVTLEAYRKAGGGILRDLFQPEHEGYLTNPALLDRLVAEKLEREAEAVRAEGWGWVRIVPQIGHDTLNGFGRIYPDRPPLSPAQQEELDSLTETYDALASACGDDPNEETATRLEALSERIDVLSEGGAVWPPDAVARTGAIVSIGYNGELGIERGLVRPEDRKAFAAEANGKAAGRGASIEARPDPAAPHPALLVEDLTARRTAALRALLKDNVAVALASVAHALALPLFYEGQHQAESCLDLRIRSRDLRRNAEGIGSDRAHGALESASGLWKEQLPPDPAALFGWLLRQDQATLAGLIAFCAAMSVDAVRGKQDRPECPRLAHADELAAALGLDMAAWWHPTKDGYLRRIPKTMVLAAVAEGVSKQAADNLVALKKDALAATAEQRLAGTGWLPAFLRSLNVRAAAEVVRASRAVRLTGLIAVRGSRPGRRTRVRSSAKPVRPSRSSPHRSLRRRFIHQGQPAMPRRKPTAPARSPWWMTRIHEFDGVEIHPCRTETAADGSTFQEQCDPEAAEVWFVFGHKCSGGVDSFIDFRAEVEARSFALKLLTAYPHLMKFGLMG